MTTAIAGEEAARLAADSSLDLRISNEVSTRSSQVASLGVDIDDAIAAQQAADTSLETKYDAEILVERLRLNAITAGTGSPDLENFSQVVSYVNALETVNDANLASDVLSLNQLITDETANRISQDASVATLIANEVSSREAAVTALETAHSTLIADEVSLLSSLETRENSRHNKIEFSNTASLVVAGSSFPTGFEMQNHGMFQIFEDDGAGALHAIVAPMQYDTSTGDVTFTFESAISGVIVFYSFADDEGAVTV